jgi:uncharacterized protein (TIGR02453 family)
MRDFSGFQSETLAFLRELSQNNDKTWFDANRERYEAYYIEPAKAFVAAIGEDLQQLVPGINADPRVNGSIFRINRDIRFSRDKTPYKDHLDLWFWEGQRKGALSGLFFRLTADGLILGAGAHRFTPEQLADFRAALEDADKGRKLLQIGGELAAAGAPLRGEYYKAVPRGFHAEDPRLAGLAKFNALYSAFETAHPANLDTPRFLDHCLDCWRNLVPLHRWLAGM